MNTRRSRGLACTGCGQPGLSRRRAGHCAIFHSIQPYIIAIDCLARHFGRNIDPRRRLADDLESAKLFEGWWLVGEFPLPTVLGYNFVEGQGGFCIALAAKAASDQLYVLHRGLQLPGRFRPEQFTQRGGGLTQWRVHCGNRAAAGRPASIRRANRGRRLGDVEIRPADAQFF
jgi:hypothetical protein